MNEKARLVFKGHLNPDAFIEFAGHRARRLDITLEITSADDAALSVTVEGAADLVDAFEMACSLGPYDCLVLDVVRTAA
ncbi:hypothetical protein ADU59_14705 [Pararhizobium polonicum]|uniref:Acylphosphatase n=1 Tax=Pararhizobium polonicum TaxID=1612624 RepID=A0A1C7P155_9HYPH|nr:hypothetical protein [Pararhizobium polonicum]OBZ95033.1 hypothetical protein ADU59_14705 [Pararhizobium polonicum]